MSHCDKSRNKIHTFFGIGLMNNALVSVACGAGLVGIDPGDQDQLILDLLVDLRKPADIIANSLLIIR